MRKHLLTFMFLVRSLIGFSEFSDEFWFDDFVVIGTEDITTILQAHQNDIIINEFFADPNPSIGLPEYEYLEQFKEVIC